MEWELLVGVLLVVPVALYLLDRWRHSYWRRRGVFQLEPTFFFGNVLEIFFSKSNLMDTIDQIYKQHKDKKLIGFYSFYKNLLVVTDPVLAKEALTKDFQSFSASGMELDEKVEPMVAINPFGTIDYYSWKERRAIHVTQHTPSKLRCLPGHLHNILHSMLKYISGFSGGPIRVKDIAELLTIDSAVSSFYGMEPGAFEDQDYIFRKHAKDTVFSPQADSAFISSLLYPVVGRLRKFRFVSYQCHEFFTSLTYQLIAQREREPKPRGDIIDVIIKADKKLRSEGKKGLSEDERTAHMLVAYLDPVFSTSIALRSILLDLASNPEIQERVREEILASGGRPEDFDTLEKINSLKYLHMIINESLRKHPVLPLMSRMCSKVTELGGVPIEPGAKLLIPIGNYHNDPDFFPDPEEYRPERFQDWKDGEGPFYPFGEGPRMCLGFRYAQILMKLALIFILNKYKINPAKETDIKDFFVKDYLFAQPSEEAILLFVPI